MSSSRHVKGRIGPLSLSFLLGVVISAVFVVGFTAGTVFGTRRSSANSASNDKNLRDFLTAYHLVTQRSYYRPFDRKHLVYAAIDGMLAATGDPHTLFFSPSDNRVATQELNGVQFSGIGAIVVQRQKALYIWATMPKAPATKAGLQPDDVVTRINGHSVAAMTSQQAIERIHGPAGSIVRLTVVRGHRAPFTVRVRREPIPPITAYGRVLGNHIGYLEISSYGETTSQEVATALTALQARHIRGLVIDLRDNPGGYVDAAQRIVSEFVSRGVVAYERGTNHQLTPLPVVAARPMLHVPIAILVNGGTASAAEITAGALRDDVHARLFGTRTYGKGSMQSVYALSDGSSIRLTDRLWLTPDHQSIQGKGLAPDVTVPYAGLSNSLSDPQLHAAQHYLETVRSR